MREFGIASAIAVPRDRNNVRVVREAVDEPLVRGGALCWPVEQEGSEGLGYPRRALPERSLSRWQLGAMNRLVAEAA